MLWEKEVSFILKVSKCLQCHFNVLTFYLLKIRLVRAEKSLVCNESKCQIKKRTGLYFEMFATYFLPVLLEAF